MINYDPTLISVEIVRLKSITTALGGSIAIVDEDKSNETKEITKRVVCPLSVARAFIQTHKKVTKYLIPVLTALVRYDDKIISMERHPLGVFGQLEGEDLQGQAARWEPNCLANLGNYVDVLINSSNKDWYFDGRYVYSFKESTIEETFANATNMSNDGRFRKLDVLSMDLQVLSRQDKLEPTDRSCVAYIASNGKYSISPPIWKDVMSIGGSRMDQEEDGTEQIVHNFDAIDEKMAVNLNFALAAGKLIGSIFGYDQVQPLQLPRLMVELHTVNLPNIQQQVKATYNIGMSFTHSFAWLLGLLQGANDLDTLIMMRSLMKYLTKKGIYRKDSFKQNNIFLENKTIDDIEVRSIDEIIQENDFSRISLSHIINKAKTKQSKTTTEGLQLVGGLSAD